MLLRTSFISCLKGALIGDCVGEKFEFTFNTSQKALACQKIDELEKAHKFLPYTDDTAMTRCISASFIAKKTVDPYDIAKRFCHEYFTDTVYNRNYGSHVPLVFQEHMNLQEEDDVFAAAGKQFNGSGSYGNGSAMRVAPVALYTFGYDFQLTSEINKCVSMITHSHPLSIQGSLVMCLAIKAAMNHRKCRPLIVDAFLAEILQYLPENSPFVKSLNEIPKLLQSEGNEDEVIKSLGNGVESLYSVPICIFCFLKSLKPIAGINRDNSFERSIVYAISMGGDTDTIGSMTGAIAGAYHTLDGVSPAWNNICEGIDLADTHGSALYNMHEEFSDRDDRRSLRHAFRHSDD